MASVVRHSLGGGRLGFLVPVLAVDHRGEPVKRVALDVLPDVQHRSARRVDQRAARRVEALQLANRDPEGGEDDDVLAAEGQALFLGIAQESDRQTTKLVVDVGVMDDLAGEEARRLGNRFRAW